MKYLTNFTFIMSPTLGLRSIISHFITILSPQMRIFKVPEVRNYGRIIKFKIQISTVGAKLSEQEIYVVKCVLK